MNVENELLKNLDRLHTTELGVVRIKKNLSLETNDVVNWCKTKIESPNAIINRKGKNWYISVYDCIITVNVHSYTIITAHKEKKWIAKYKGQKHFPLFVVPMKKYIK